MARFPAKANGFVIGILRRGRSPRAASLRQFYFEHYGTSLNGLRRHHGVDPFAYLSYVHDVPLENYLSPDPGLRRMLEDLAVLPVIFTNADAAHARRVLSLLGVSDLVEIGRASC